MRIWYWQVLVLLEAIPRLCILGFDLGLVGPVRDNLEAGFSPEREISLGQIRTLGLVERSDVASAKSARLRPPYLRHVHASEVVNQLQGGEQFYMKLFHSGLSYTSRHRYFVSMVVLALVLSRCFCSRAGNAFKFRSLCFWQTSTADESSEASRSYKSVPKYG